MKNCNCIMETNELILSNLQVLLKEAQSGKEVKDRFRARAYRNAIKEIKKLTIPIRSGADAAKLPGIGKKIADKIQEIIDTGELHQVQELGTEQLEYNKGLQLFTKIWGVGPVKAKELWKAGARTVKDIETNPNVYDLLNDNQKIGLQYFDDLQKRIPQSRIEPVVEEIKKGIRDLNIEHNLKIRSRVCGSFRRKKPTLGDMDLLVIEENDVPVINLIVDALKERGIILESLGLGPTKYMGIIRVSTENDEIAFRLDIESVKKEEWPFALLYFTGSGGFNEQQRLVAKKMGYRLSEHGIKEVDTGVMVSGIETEKDIFDFLGMKYLPPWDR